MAATRVALATQRALPDWEVDDLPFQEALGARGIGYDCVAWDDPDIAWSAYDAILLRTTWDYMEKADAFREWIGYAATQTRLFNPVEILRWNLQKTYLRALAAEGVPLAPTLWVAGGEAVALEDWLAAHEATRGFIKPVVGCCAWESLRFDCDAAGFEAASTLASLSQAASSRLEATATIAVTTTRRLTVAPSAPARPVPPSCRGRSRPPVQGHTAPSAHPRGSDRTARSSVASRAPCCRRDSHR